MAYTKMAIVEIEEIKQGAIFELFSPFVITDERGLRLAEYTLGALNTSPANKNETSKEMVMNMDMENWDEQIKALNQRLKERERRLSSGY